MVDDLFFIFPSQHFPKNVLKNNWTKREEICGSTKIYGSSKEYDETIERINKTRTKNKKITQKIVSSRSLYYSCFLFADIFFMSRWWTWIIMSFRYTRQVTLFVLNCLRKISFFKKKISKIFRVKGDLLHAVCDLLAKYSRLVYGQQVWPEDVPPFLSPSLNLDVNVV